MNCLACGNQFEGVAGTPCPQCGSVNATTGVYTAGSTGGKLWRQR